MSAAYGAPVRSSSAAAPGRTGGICVIGPGTRFLSGVTYHTYGLANALAESSDRPVSALLLRRLLPRRWYPGAARVGEDLTHLRFLPGVARFDGIDWYWLPSLIPSLWFLVRHRPSHLIVAWWTAAVAHTLLVLVGVGRLLGANVVVEIHETLDPGERRHAAVRRFGRWALRRLCRLSHAVVFHSGTHRDEVLAATGARPPRVDVIPLVAWSHYQLGRCRRPAAPEVCNVLFFGVIRPFKGLEDLLDAFEAIPEDEIGDWWLTVVGETWEGHTAPAERIRASRYRHRITFVNRYVRDEEVDAFFGGADVVALPYRRSAGSGPLAVAMAYGRPVVVSDLEPLRQEAGGYGGAIFVPVGDPAALLEGLHKAADLRTRRFAPPASWEEAAGAHLSLVAHLAAERGRP